MSLQRLLIDRCSIFHYQEGAGIDGTPTFSEKPAALEIPCRIDYGSGRDIESDANTLIFVDTELFLLPTVDIRSGDKVIVNGETYFAQVPRKIGRHHIEVPLQRSWER